MSGQNNLVVEGLPPRLNATTIQAPLSNTYVPSYPREQVDIGVVHLGISHFFRAHQAMFFDDLLQRQYEEFLAQGQPQARLKWGISAVSTQTNSSVNRLLDQDNLYTVVIHDNDRLNEGDGVTKRVVKSVSEVLYAPHNESAVIARISNPDVKFVTVTVGPRGYDFHHSDKLDKKSIHYYLTEGLLSRFKAGFPPPALVSCDNIKSNGDNFRDWFLKFLGDQQYDLVPGFKEWVEKEVPFPNTMVDRLTPHTDQERINALAAQTGYYDEQPIFTEGVAEWVIESFEKCQAAWGARPPLEQVGVRFVEDSKPFENAKLRILNGAHRAIGYAGVLLGIKYVHEFMDDPDCGAFIEALTAEMLPSLKADPNTERVGLNVDGFREQTLDRFRNTNLDDRLERLTKEGSAKMKERLFIVAVANDQIGMPTKFTTLAIAVWLRYCRGVSESGQNYFGALEDEKKADLLEKAIEGKEDPRPLLTYNNIVPGAFIEREHLVAETARALESIYAHGVRETIRRYMREDQPQITAAAVNSNGRPTVDDETARRYAVGVLARRK